MVLVLLSGCATQTQYNQSSSSIARATPTPKITAPNSPQPTPTVSATPIAPPPIPPQPTSLPEPRQRGKFGDDLTVYNELPNSLGIGHLRPQDMSFLSGSGWVNDPLSGAGWLSKVMLPLYKQPGGELWGWLARGWPLPPSESTKPQPNKHPLAMFETSWGFLSFIVLELRPDGWFRFQYSEPNLEDDGTIWAHISHLDLGEMTLVIERWEEFFPQVSMLYFREEPQLLRTLPTNSSEQIISIDWREVGYDIEIIAFRGDWAQVRVKKPYEPCPTSPEQRPKSQTYEGWIRWRTPERGSLLWYPIKGC